MGAAAFAMAPPPMAVEQARSQAASCPVPPPPMWSLALCARLCAADADCRAGGTCCSNGCGSVCYQRRI
jgi:hypothetical protein